jgi:hypothetical protein
MQHTQKAVAATTTTTTDRKNVPSRVDNLLKQRQGLRHAVAAFILKQLLVILGYGSDKQDRGHVFEAMNPLKEQHRNTHAKQVREQLASTLSFSLYIL